MSVGYAICALIVLWCGLIECQVDRRLERIVIFDMVRDMRFPRIAEENAYQCEIIFTWVSPEATLFRLFQLFVNNTLERDY